jgi:hypothetical protein
VRTSKPPANFPLYSLKLLVSESKNTSPLEPTFLSRKSLGLGIIRILSTIGADDMLILTFIATVFIQYLKQHTS